ncbi:hypothetical protein MMC06_005335 [Schaereria dolodes]|nr:hypothetical protein [Schaereria dolodes]
MATPRRTTRASSRASTPLATTSAAPVIADSAPRTRSGARPHIQVKQSTSYGSSGVPPMRVQVIGLPLTQDPTDAIAAGVKLADKRQEKAYRGKGKLLAVPEEGYGNDEEGEGSEGIGGVGPSYTMGGGYGDDVETGGNEGQPPKSDEGQSKSFAGEGYAGSDTPGHPGSSQRRMTSGNSNDSTSDVPVDLDARGWYRLRSFGILTFKLVDMLAKIATPILLALLFYILIVDPTYFQSVSVTDAGPGRRVLGRWSLETRVNQNLAYLSERSKVMAGEIKDLRASSSGITKVNRVNYFSTGLGAVVDPHLTSPTKMVKRSVKSRLIASWNSITLRQSRPPVEALGPWDDIGDCWCAPPSGGPGKSQLSVILPREMVPSHLVVEHIHRDATLDIGAAPQEIEFYVQILDDDTREAVAKSALSRLFSNEWKQSRDKQPDPGERQLDKTWVRIGEWIYDIKGENNVQTFEIPVAINDFDAAIRKVVVRVTSNWGNQDYVCLYRLKLYGRPQAIRVPSSIPPDPWA